METFYQPHNYNYPYQDEYYWHYQQDYTYYNHYNGYNEYNHYDNFYYHNQTPQAQPVSTHIIVPPPVQAYESALALPSVIYKILSHCTIQDLKQKRKVCKQWNKEVCRILHEKHVIRFNSHRRMKSYFKMMNDHRKFCSAFYFGPEIYVNGSFVLEWMKEFGPNIRSFELQTYHLHLNSLGKMLHYLQNLETLILPSTMLADSNPIELRYDCQLPKLKSLTFLRNMDVNSTDTGAIMKPLFHEMLRIAINLEQIGFSGRNSSDEVVLKNMEISDLNVASNKDNTFDHSSLDTCLWSTLLESRFVQAITKMELNVKLTNYCVQTLTAKKFPLKSMALKILPEVSNKVLHKLLTSLKETLVCLKIRFCGNDRLAYEADLPLTEPLPNVISVHLERYQGSLWFVEKLPNLLQLSFGKINLNKIALKDADCPQRPEGVHGTLRSFKVYQDSSNNTGCNRQRSIQTVQKLGIQFPSIRKLRLEKLVDESLCLIYAQWPNLEELEIVHGLFSDSGTTAIHPNAYKVIHREEAYDHFNVDALRQGLFLGNLSKLASLKIHSPHITDVTLILGVLSCPNIKNVSVQSFQITDTSLYRLLNKPTILHLSTKNCNQLTTQAVSFASKILTARGGSSSLNECKGSLSVHQTVQFLKRNPKLRVLLKRLSIKSIKPNRSNPFGKPKILVPQISKPCLSIRKMRTRLAYAQSKVQKQNVIANVAEQIAQPQPNINELQPLLPAKPNRPTRNTESIFKRFKDFALF